MESLRELDLVVARLLLAAVFLYSAVSKARFWNASIAEVSGLGLPLPRLFAATTVATQLTGGLSMALGLWSAIGAAALAGFTIAATLLGHRFWLLHGVQAQRELTTSLEHAAIVGGLLLIVEHGFSTG